MKRIFCDVCGEEFKYEDAIRSLHNKEHTMLMKRVPGQEVIEAVLKIQFHPVNKDGEHKDICGACVWRAISSLDPRGKCIPPAREW